MASMCAGRVSHLSNAETILSVFSCWCPISSELRGGHR
jgi:hypothetical protein